ncbi:synaptic vesicle 2-related protein-like [Anticarsia gemmatalis]|uniref:synaptic vesicle 2-related protein-like n=1 Tax=Anticarsia gemmatalis TaxID=129554 RepID=UPI003F773582
MAVDMDLDGKFQVQTISVKDMNPDNKEYEYEEALDITGTGWYNRTLLIALGIGLLAMGIDVFGFSIVVTGCSCDFQLEIWQKSALLSMPFVGPVIMSIPWGYISDTQGRRKTLLIALWGSFLFSFISVFSVHWIMLAVLKVFSSMFCSAVQSGAYALLGESCTRKVRGFYMLIMTSVLMLYMLSYIVPGYFILQLAFDYNLGLITFTPWRLLTMVMATPLLISAVVLHFCYESPKFLIAAGREKEALENLNRIWVRNGGEDGKYPVSRVILKDNSKAQDEGLPILKSLWLQTMPLFKPPLLLKTIQLFFLTFVIYSINSCWVMWMPSIVEAFDTGINSNDTEGSTSLCSIISSISAKNTTGVNDAETCSSSIQSLTLLSGIIHGVIFAGITLAVSKLASRKKTLLIMCLLVPLLSSLGAVFNQNHVASIVLFVGMMMTNLCMGVLFVYYVEMFPTSYRGMASCLGVMVARLSGIGGVNLLGSYVMSHCTFTFFASSIILLAGIIVAWYFLPPDGVNKNVK